MQIIVISQALPGILRMQRLHGIGNAARVRHIALATLFACSFALFGAAPVQAVGSRHPFCLQGDEYPGLSACTFDTYAQCLATASGRKVYCIANPYFAGETDDPYAYGNRDRRFPPQYYPVRPGDYPIPPGYYPGRSY
jgi:Protein of unknown function (DUF3551)